MLPERLARKFWGHIEKKLLDIKNTDACYIGGTLNFSLDRDRGIALNLDGSGFVINRHEHMKNQTFCQPDFILKNVRKIYLSEKGKNDHYKESVKKRKI